MIRAFTWGTFNILHDGHREFLQNIQLICNEIHIVLIPDTEVFKNKNYIPLNWSTRKANIEKFGSLNHIRCIIHYDSYNLGLKSLLKFKPDFFLLGYDQKTIWEKRLKSVFVENDLNTEIIRLKEFAQGVHCAHFRR